MNHPGYHLGEGVAKPAPVQLSVGAVIVNFNGGARVLGVIEALQRQTYPPDEIVVVDNHSSDGSPARINNLFSGVEMVRLPRNIGPAGARNAGLRAIGTTLAFLVDHDIYADATAIERMVAAYHRHRPTVICPRIRLLPERDTVQMQGAAVHFLGLLILRHGYQPIERVPTEPGLVDACAGGCLLVHRQTVLDAGAFDELYFFYFEDLEFSLRLRACDHRIWCESSAEVFHDPGAGTPGLSYRRSGDYPSRRAYLTMRNRLLTIFIHYRLRTILLLGPALALFEVATLVIACRRGWVKEWLRAWHWQYGHAAEIRKRRSRSKNSRKLGDRALLVGGPPPLAPGFLSGPLEQRLFKLFSAVVNAYWALARNWIG